MDLQEILGGGRHDPKEEWNKGRENLFLSAGTLKIGQVVERMPKIIELAAAKNYVVAEGGKSASDDREKIKSGEIEGILHFGLDGTKYVDWRDSFDEHENCLMVGFVGRKGRSDFESLHLDDVAALDVIGILNGAGFACWWTGNTMHRISAIA